jgi:hypothetical protein
MMGVGNESGLAGDDGMLITALCATGGEALPPLVSSSWR